MGKIVDAKWTPTVNYLIIECDNCGCRYEARADRWRLRCFQCQFVDNMQNVRDRTQENK